MWEAERQPDGARLSHAASGKTRSLCVRLTLDLNLPVAFDFDVLFDLALRGIGRRGSKVKAKATGRCDLHTSNMLTNETGNLGEDFFLVDVVAVQNSTGAPNNAADAETDHSPLRNHIDKIC